MKFKIKLKLILLILIYNIIYSNQLKLRARQNFVGDNPDDADSERLPKMINFQIEDGDTDPVNMSKFENDKREINNKLSQAQILFEKEKRNLMNIISMQNSKIAQLSVIADSNNELLLELLNNDKK